ncbi:acylphosphatase [Bifidobacterium apri]|uniref:acylphosphatase n=1 Tax=Bifidobacterium apri TaxID=1769423 RepID=UPI003993DE34
MASHADTPRSQSSQSQSRVHMVVTGVVQGVGFRYFTVMAARRYDLTGWVRNRMDGSVELEAQGAGIDVERFERAVEGGPRWSRVEHVDIDIVPVVPGEQSFSVHSDR